MDISREKFAAIVKAAFEEGWYGSVNSKDDYVERITSEIYDIEMATLAKLRQSIEYQSMPIDDVAKILHQIDGVKYNFVACSRFFLKVFGVKSLPPNLSDYDNQLIATMSHSEEVIPTAIFYMNTKNYDGDRVILAKMHGANPNKIEVESAIAIQVAAEVYDYQDYAQ